MIRFANCRQIVQVCAAGEQRLSGEAQGSVAVLECQSLVVGVDGNIAAIGDEATLAAQFPDVERVVDASQHVLMPGLVDGHTHPVWAGDRVHEFAMKLAGATYMDIHAKVASVVCMCVCVHACVCA